MKDRAGYVIAGLCLAALWAGSAQSQSERYRGYPSDFGVVASASNWEAVTPSDVTNFTYRPRAIYCNSAGDVAAVDADGNVEVFTVAEGARLDIRPSRINDTGTTDGIDLIAIR